MPWTPGTGPVAALMVSASDFRCCRALPPVGMLITVPVAQSMTDTDELRVLALTSRLRPSSTRINNGPAPLN